MAIKVRAKETGFYGTKLRYEGDEFDVSFEHELGRWMEVLGSSETVEEEEETRPRRRRPRGEDQA